MNYKTKARSKIEIEERASIIRKLFSVFYPEIEGDRFPVLNFVEHVIPRIDENFNFVVVSTNELKDCYAVTDINDNTIKVREDVYDRAVDGNERDLFTIAHELGHLLLHSNQKVELARGDSPMMIYESTEWQANTFAAALLMPADKITSEDTKFTVARKFGVSITAAELRLKKLGISNQ
ncbi:ImmA/IrrE family metallo-endopeptidase [Paraclostridium sordellii]|uniref:ImmA/IrrE family metallo-endopeptidase n=1 Tax=Paraclostridium sordellii TaxID=1505 RepID=UPI0022DEA201|nr:ImmA/IrrE family metallo-endopeptidase [Paeniclostridium sordellii]